MKEVFTQEYQMLMIYRPNTLLFEVEKEEEDPFNTPEKTIMERARIDRTRLEDPEYVAELRKEKGEGKATLTLQQYIEQEEEESDLFLFTKFVTPSMFKKYVGTQGL